MSRRLSGWQKLAAGLMTLALFVAIVLLGATWYYSDEIWDGAFAVDDTPPTPDVRILAVTPDTIRLGPLPGTDMKSAWSEDGVVGLDFENGYAQLGAVLDRHPDSVLRELHIVSGKPEAGMEAHANPTYFNGDPRTSLGLDFEDVSVPSDVGMLPAWFVPGTGATWLIFVHGKGSSRQEGLRLFDAVRGQGLPFLAITYRNDPEAPSTGHYAYGVSEWRDLEAAVAYAKGRGAKGVIIAGHSMGGAIVLSFLEHSSIATEVRGVILNAPVIDFAATIDFLAHKRHLPGVMATAAEWLTARRFGIDWQAMDHRDVAAHLKAPLLLIHGDADQTVPVATSDAFAASRPDMITFYRVAGAGHVRAWNHDPRAYETVINTFLGRVNAAASP
jgi:pimeloyl-ACP methyl ester carboxylesterase